MNAETIALGDSPYLEEAHFYLAKAYLQKGNTDEAKKLLQSTVRLRSEREAEARLLLRQLQTLAAARG
jgi:lipoprotein NlpI